MGSRTDEAGARFAFGRNWDAFSHFISEERIGAASDGLRKLLRVEALTGQRFLDIGCGSGLSSLAALRLGATVHAFDYDPELSGNHQTRTKSFRSVGQQIYGGAGFSA